MFFDIENFLIISKFISVFLGDNFDIIRVNVI